MEDNNNQGNGLGSAALLREIIRQRKAKAPEGSPQAVAEEYARSKGISLDEPDLEVKARPNVSQRVAQAYAEMEHAPNDPKVMSAYNALIGETEDQYRALEKAGLKIEKITPEMGNPYANSKAVVEDITKNKHMYYFPTEAGYGADGVDAVKDHPLLKPSKVMGPDGKPMPANDLFRVVHDYFGHAKDGNKFGATGEERAYLEHSKMYSPEARKALASETRGQNSWVNYGPMGEANRANPANTIYAEQKAGLLPDWATKHVDEIDSPIKYKAKALAKMAGKASIPLLSAGASLAEPTADQALVGLVVPGGAESAGMSPEQESQMLAEIDAQKAYQSSPARNDKNQLVRMNVLRSMAGK
jgi:hypothetical protein